MDARIAVRERRSIRCFRPDEVPENIIREILDVARWAPSWGNTQPWEFYVVTGNALEKFKKLNRQQYMDGIPPSPEIPMPRVWPEVLKKRYTSLGKRLLTSMSIAREDTEGRSRYYAKMYGLFGAPCLILTCIEKSLSIEYAMIDVGLINQTICLLGHERNLGTCMLAASVSYPKLLRELLPIPKDKLIVIGTVLGYPDWDSPENHFERERATIDEQVTWVS
ncbi:MAG: nitroreductase [Syntrophaceae bacterium]|nr:nitroreductase [Syntrophaceae bacterium]